MDTTQDLQTLEMLEARELAASERISAALAFFDEATAGYDMWDPDLEEIRFEAMKAAIAMADASKPADEDRAAIYEQCARTAETWRCEPSTGADDRERWCAERQDHVARRIAQMIREGNEIAPHPTAR